MRYLNKKVWPYQIELKDILEPIQNGPYMVCDNRIGKIEDWCKQHIGKRHVDWYSFSFKYNMIYTFKDEGDMLIFKITWRQNGA